MDAMAADPRAPQSLDAMARRAGFSTRHFSRLFRRELGTTRITSALGCVQFLRVLTSSVS
ncbi:AraC family transcriptional regulator [Streptomyces humicola]|uniref:AraC family transcriptional regulator n=1 Tax=Streptomyces humicola TaxID=2953240 RepID=UPI00355783A7